ncbi:MAG: zinc ribbon domain-containing protein [Lentisphaerae bacterium]|nr:zinc ribbon domain-containing protein [Lentisphaerota bacterium]
MPIYEYTCRKCGERFEYLARRLNEAAPRCPGCGASRPVKELSVFSAGESRKGGSLPCAGGACPAPAAAGGGCAGGCCPLE